MKDSHCDVSNSYRAITICHNTFKTIASHKCQCVSKSCVQINRARHDVRKYLMSATDPSCRTDDSQQNPCTASCTTVVLSSSWSYQSKFVVLCIYASQRTVLSNQEITTVHGDSPIRCRKRPLCQNQNQIALCDSLLRRLPSYLPVFNVLESSCKVWRNRVCHAISWYLDFCFSFLYHEKYVIIHYTEKCPPFVTFEEHDNNAWFL